MYGRQYGGKELNFEASGGLMHYSLVMMDKETDSYWSIMTGGALSGEFKETPLEELPLGVKTQWKDWVREHPNTRVLSVDGQEYVDDKPYESFYDSEEGFRGSRAKDRRLPTKTSIYAFQRGGQAYAVPFDSIAGGARVKLRGETAFLYRPPGVAIFYSTVAYVAPGEGFHKQDGVWRDKAGTVRFDEQTGEWVGGTPPQRLDGFDTFWFNWSMTHPRTKVRKGKPR